MNYPTTTRVQCIELETPRRELIDSNNLSISNDNIHYIQILISYLYEI